MERVRRDAERRAQRLRARLERAMQGRSEHGYDVFGMHLETTARALEGGRWLYERWFRVSSHGVERLPGEGGAILAANHSGTLPFDGVMIYTDVALGSEPARVARPVVDRFVPRLPYVGSFFARVGGVVGTRSNVRLLLERGEMLLIFPEGAPGVGKRFSQRYELQGWRVGHAELAIRHRVPVVPVAVIGAEEQMPQVTRLPVRLFGAPWLPVPLTLVPLPVRYHIHYGAPLALHERYGVEAADEPEAVEAAAAEVKAAVAGLIEEGLRARRGVFR